MEWDGAHVLITGGLGFIGSSLAHALVAEKAAVTLLDASLPPYGANRYNLRGIDDAVQVVDGDIRDAECLAALMPGMTHVFHLAGQVGRLISMDDPYLDVDINLVGTLRVLDAVRAHAPGARVVFAGSRGEVGEPVYLPVDEEHPDRPTDLYGANKLAAEKYCMVYHTAYGLRTTVLRINNVYGPRCQMKHGHYGVLNLFVGHALRDEELTVFGEGTQTRDYIYIDDVVDAFLRAGREDAAIGRMYQVGSGTETVFLDMVAMIVEAAGSGRVTHVPFPEQLATIDITRFVVTPEKLRTELGWAPRVPLRDGIMRTVAYYRDHLDAYL